MSESMSSQKKDVKYICDIMWRVERDYELNDFELGGVKVWQYARIAIYYYLASCAGVFINPHAQKRDIFSRSVRIFRYLYSAVFRNPFLNLGRSDEVVIEHSRTALFEDDPIDIYSNFHVERVRSCGERCLLLDPADINSRHLKRADPDRRFLDFIPVIKKIFGHLSSVRLTPVQREKIDAVNACLSNAVGSFVDVRPILVRSVMDFKVGFCIYRRLFLRVKPRRLTVVVGYAYGDAIAAAKSLNIETFELQHGTFSRYHLGYSYPSGAHGLEYFPDKFLAWGRFWRDMDVLPLVKSNIVLQGFTYFNRQRQLYTCNGKTGKRIVILSQAALGEKISEEVYRLRSAFSGYDLIYKLHPSEYERWREYPFLRALVEEINIEVVASVDLYSLLASASYQVGVFSTALYEGIGLGCKTFLLNLPGVEYMDALLEQGVAELVCNEIQLREGLEVGVCNSGAFAAEVVFGN